MADVLKFPGKSHRLAVIGRTGTGKTQAALWHLSGWNFATFPWLIWDIKRDPMLAELGRMPEVRHIGFSDNPRGKGLYMIRPRPHEMKSDECEQFIWRMHARGNVGNFIDEMYMFDKYSPSLNALYTQGRTLKLPIIGLSQKPKYVTQFMLSESDFFQTFQLNDKNDRKRISEFMPADLEKRLRPYHSLWYDVGSDQVTEFSPVPARDVILNSFDAQMRRLKRVI